MDKIASALLAFPPSEGIDLNSSDDKEYDLAAKAHVKRLNQLMNDKASNLAGHAAQLLQVGHPGGSPHEQNGTDQTTACRPDRQFDILPLLVA